MTQPRRDPGKDATILVPDVTSSPYLLDAATPAPNAGAAIRRRRRAIRLPKANASGEIRYRQMSMRDLEERLQALEAADPRTYRAYSRAVQVEIENRGEAYLLESIKDGRMVNALIAALFDGSVSAFEQETGITLPLLRLLRAPRPLYEEGDPHFGQRERRATTPHPCDFLVRVEGETNAPLLVPGQLVGMVKPQARADVANQLVALVDPRSGGLELALASERLDLTTARGEPLAGVGYGDVVGVASWVGPRPRRLEDPS